MQKNKWTKNDYEAMAPSVLSANEGIYKNAVSGLKRFSSLTTADQDAELKELTEIMEGHVAEGANVVSPMPTKVTQSVVAQLENQVLADTMAEQLCQIDTVAPGESIVYKTRTRDAFTIKKIGEMGGRPVELRFGGNETYAALGNPVVYSSQELAIPVWNHYFPRKYMDEVEYVTQAAAYDLVQNIDTDIWTMLDTQYSSAWTQSTVFQYVSSRVQDMPTGNDINVSASADGADHFTLDSFLDLMLHGQRMGRTLRQLFIPTLIKKDIWNWAHLVASSQGFSNLSEQYRAELERTGGSVLSYAGEPPVRVTPLNILDGNATNTYGRALYEPTANYNRMAPRGAALVYWETIDPEVLTNLIVHLRRAQTPGGAIMDFYVFQKSCLITALPYQQPNYARFQIISA